jgi:hypothetical protein
VDSLLPVASLRSNVAPLDLRRVEFSQVQQPALHCPMPADPYTLAKRIVDMLLLILSNNSIDKITYPRFSLETAKDRLGHSAPE